MTYLGFHLVFTIPPIILLLGFLAADRRSQLREMAPGIGFIAVVAVLYTTPWDNYLVYREVWVYGADRVIGTIGYVPVEEYAFFVLQTVLTGLFLTWRLSKRTLPSEDRPQPAAPARWVVAAFLFLVGILGGYALTTEPTLYLGLILAWAAPILLLQWLLGAKTLIPDAQIWIPVVTITTLYLGFADHFAISSGIWGISSRFTTGLDIAGLPIEEALFFFVTNLLVAWGLLLYHEFVTTSRRPTP